MARAKLTEEDLEAFRKLNEEALAFRSGGKGRAISILISFIVFLILCYFWLPAFNVKDQTLYKTLALTLAVYCLMRVATSGFYKPSRNTIQTIRFLFREEKPALFSLLALAIIWIAGMIISSQLFFPKQYHELLVVSDGNFTDDVDRISYDKIPMIDEQAAIQLGSRALGELSDLVSQFETSENYTQINLNDVSVRVAPLEYGNLFKWFTNRENGLPGYVAVNMLTQTATIVRTEQGISYSESEPLFRNIKRYLRIHYPSYLFGECHLEIDEAGQPWWVCPHIDHTIGLFGGSDTVGAVLVQASSGKTIYYAVGQIPQWVDQLFDADLIVQQYNWYGKYADGFWNSILSQSGVTTTTEGTNYITIDDDVYLYTGITSSGIDESNIGFILCNLRTKETRYYEIPGATELSAQKSAEGTVQNLGYTATFPLLLNIANEPTYFMALKDGAGLVKKYAMVNVEQYQIVATGDTVESCEAAYTALLQAKTDQEAETQYPESTRHEISGRVSELRENVIDGVTTYYIKLDESQQYFRLSAKLLPEAVLLDIGRQVWLEYQLPYNDIFADVQTLEFIS